MSAKTPGQCSGMEEIRDEVNAIDREIIGLLGRRLYDYTIEVQLALHRSRHKE